MSKRGIVDYYLRTRSNYWRLQRLLFPSPAEVRFMQLMGAKIRTVGFIRMGVHDYPLVLVLSRGKILRRAKIKRERRIGKCYVDFANDIFWCIEIDGSAYHQDVVADFDREVYLREFLRRQHKDLRIMRIPAYRLWHDKARVQREVLAYLNS